MNLKGQLFEREKEIRFLNRKLSDTANIIYAKDSVISLKRDVNDLIKSRKRSKFSLWIKNNYSRLLYFASGVGAGIAMHAAFMR